VSGDEVIDEVEIFILNVNHVTDKPAIYLIRFFTHGNDFSNTVKVGVERTARMAKMAYILIVVMVFL